MADENTPPNTDLENDPSKNNPEVVQKLKDQSLDNIEINKDAESVLDGLMKDAETKSDPEAQKAAEEKAAAEKKAADDEAARKAAEADPEAAAKKAAEEKAAAEKADAEKKKADDLFKDSPSLPQNASPKSAEAFASIKIKATQEITARDTKIAQLEKEKKELEAKLANPIPPELEQEVKSLREWRAKLDVEVDPKFKEYDKSISQAQEFIYAQLKKSPKISDEIIAAIKKEGGPENIQLDKVFAAIGDPTIQRLVESKIADIEQAKFNRDQAIKAAKENITGYIQQREKEFADNATKHNVETEGFLKQHIPKLPYLQRKEIPAGADEATKKAIEAHNANADQITLNMQAALKDDSPEMRAVMIVGMAQLLHLQPQLSAANARVAQLEKELKEANEKITKFKGASVSRLRESAAPTNGKLPEKKPDVDVNTRAGDALDSIMKQVQDERSRAVNQ